MARRFYISLLALIFFVSTTSLPVSIHLCSMMGYNDVETCKMCAAEKAKTKSSCCDNNSENTLKIKKAGSECCSNKLIDASVKENYIGNVNNLKDQNSLKYLCTVILPADVISIINTSSYYINIHSPPLVKTNPVYLINSIFLI